MRISDWSSDVCSSDLEMPPKPPETRLCTWQPDAIFYRDEDLVEEVLGKRGFTEVMFRQILGRYPSAKDLKIIDAVLVALMEHGLSPSAIMTRLAYMSAPENLQGAEIGRAHV